METNYSITGLTVKGICRICLKYTEEALDLCGNEFLKALDEIALCFQITMNREKYFPQKICKDCLQELNNAQTFRLKCESCDTKFADILQAQNVTLPGSECLFSKDFDDYKLYYSDDSNSILNNHNESTYNLESNVSKENNLDDKNNTFKCKICLKVLKTKTSLVKHNVSMHQKRKHKGKVTGFGAMRRYHCTSCVYSTPHSQTLINHMRTHDGERPYHCQCGKSFTQSASLTAHLKTHNSTTYFTCSLCGKQFKHAYTLKKHLTVHENGKYICNICNKVLKTKQSLQEHIHRHFNIRNFNCEDCGDTFVTSSELINHKRKHMLIKKVECHLCGYRTHTKKSLVLHLQRHTGNKTYKCDLCELLFYTKSDVVRHRRVHTREKPFSCPTCTQKFTYSPSLNRHMLMVHGVHFKWGETKTPRHNLKDENLAV